MIQETLDGLVGQTDNLNKIKGYRDHQFSLINRELGAIRALSEKNYYPKSTITGAGARGSRNIWQRFRKYS